MAVGLDKAGIDVQAGDIHHGSVLRDIQPLPDAGDLAAADLDIGNIGFFVDRVMDEAALEDLHFYPTFPVDFGFAPL